MTGQQPTFDDATSGEVIDCAPDWPELPAGWERPWRLEDWWADRICPTYVITTWTWDGDSPDSCSPDTTQPYPLDDLIKRIDDAGYLNEQRLTLCHSVERLGGDPEAFARHLVTLCKAVRTDAR